MRVQIFVVSMNFYENSDFNSNICLLFLTVLEKKIDIKASNGDGFGLECNMALDDCTNMWTGSNWKLTNSLSDQYGFVLDERWEGKFEPKAPHNAFEL